MNNLIEDLSQKIDFQRDLHAFHEIKWKRYSVLLKTLLIVLPAFLTFVAFSDFNFLNKYLPSLTEQMIRLCLGLVSFSLFLVGVISEVFGVAIRHEKHRDAIEQYSELRRAIREMNDDATADQIRLLNQRYIAISSNAISLSSPEFLAAEKYLLRNKAIREARKNDPFGCYLAIRKKASEIAQAGPTNGP